MSEKTAPVIALASAVGMMGFAAFVFVGCFGMLAVAAIADAAGYAWNAIKRSQTLSAVASFPA